MLSGSIASNGTGPQANYGKAYDGDYTLEGTYTVNTMGPAGMLTFDPKGSTITFKDVTPVGAKVGKFGPFNTLEIPITMATVDPKTGAVTSITFSATDWYKNLPKALTQNGLNGTIDLTKSSGTITASYQNIPADPKKTTTLNYVFTAPVPKPFPNPAPEINFVPFPGVPEPSTWVMMTLGVGLAGATLRRRRVLQAVPA